jgi:hypothetical protein
MRALLALTILLLGVFLVTGCGQETPSSVALDAQGKVPAAGNGHAEIITMGWQPDHDYILSLSTRTGLGTLGAPLGASPSYGAFGLTFDLDGTCYAMMAFYNGANASFLARLDIKTGAVTPVNLANAPELIFAGPDIDSHGNLYASGFTVGPPEDPTHPAWWGGYDLWRVNKATGAMTSVGDTRNGTGGVFAGEWMDLAFDSQDRCWTTCRNKLFLLDTTDGHSTFVTDITGVPTQYIPGDDCPEDWQYMEVMDIAFDDHDVLWGSAIRGFSPCTGYKNAPVLRIDTTTGQATIVGYAQTGGQNHGGDIMPTWVTIEHRAQDGKFVTMKIAMEALAGHLAHGDYVPGTVGDPAYPN